MLVNCVAYQNGKKLADIPVEEIGRYVSRPECFVWVALKDPEPAELAGDAARSSGSTSSRSRTRATATSGPRSRSTATRSSPCCTPSSSSDGALSLGEIDVFVGTNYVLSVRSRASRGSRTCAPAASASPTCSSTARGSCCTR